MKMSRRTLCHELTRFAAALGLLAGTGCGGGGMLSSEPKKYEGGGPLPEMKDDEITETPRARRKGSKP